MSVLEEAIRELIAIEQELADQPALARRIHAVAEKLAGELRRRGLQSAVENPAPEDAVIDSGQWGWQGRLPWRNTQSEETN